MHIPPPGDDPTVVRPEDVKAFFESMDAHAEAHYSNSRSVHKDNRVITEKRLRTAVGLTMPADRF